MQKVFSIAIDGPSGAGKSSVAKEVSRQLGAMYLDTGAMYRALGLYMLMNGMSLDDKQAIIAACEQAKVGVRYGKDGRQRVYLAEEDVSEAIRTAEASIAASKVSTVSEVRRHMVHLQRQIAKGHCVVMDGRDIGTDVLPNAALKIYLTASAEVRAQRRHKELLEKGMNEPYEKVLAELIQRDEIDTNREASPLRKAEDAIELDCSQLTLDEVVRRIIELSRLKMGD